MQDGVSITTNDSELNIIYGMINIRPEREQARSSVRYILTDLNDIRKKYFLLGFHLQECSRMKYYEDFGYTTMEEFCEKNFGLDKSTVSRCISVCLEFHKQENTINGIKEGEYLLEIDDRWKEYSYSQLVEMIPLSNEQRRMVKPEMSIKQIREFKKSLKKKPKKTDGGEVATSQLDDKYFYSDTYCKGVFGAVRQQYYKKCKAALSKLVDVVDADGRSVDGLYNVWLDILEDNSHHIVIRLSTLQKNDKPGE